MSYSPEPSKETIDWIRNNEKRISDFQFYIASALSHKFKNRFTVAECEEMAKEATRKLLSES
jgi:hypothetical protein